MGRPCRERALRERGGARDRPGLRARETRIRKESTLSWLRHFLNSTLGRKVLVGVSGIALVGFLLTHLAGNLLIYKGTDAYDH
jgi:hypothetical protein